MGTMCACESWAIERASSRAGIKTDTLCGDSDWDSASSSNKNSGKFDRNIAAANTAMFLSIIVHAMFTICIFLIACGLPGAHPTFLQHFIVVPMSIVTGTLPLPGGGLGALEFVMNFYCQNIGGSGKIPSGQGLMVALGYRVATIVVAIIGLCYYLVSRKDVSRVIHEAEHELESPEPVAV